MSGKQFANIAGLTLALSLVVSSMALAQVTVSDPTYDSVSQGDWRLEDYGDCFYLIPDVEVVEEEVPIGPDLFSQEPTQYAEANCYGGDLFAAGKIDWRIFTGNSDNYIVRPNEAYVWHFGDFFPTPPGAAQWNPCLTAFRHTTWDSDLHDYDPLSVEFTIYAGGSIQLAYYLTDGSNICRDIYWELSIDGIVYQSGTEQDYAAGRYIVFEIDGLEASDEGTVIRFDGWDAPGVPTCEMPWEYEGVNTHISGLYISGSDVCDDGGGEGCTPGYWKQSQHFFAWTAPYEPGTLFGDVFEDAFPGMTLLDVLEDGGGQLDALGRHTVAALLNAASMDVDSGLSPGQVIDMFNAAYLGSEDDLEAVKDQLEDLNEQGCPLGNGNDDDEADDHYFSDLQHVGAGGHGGTMDLFSAGSTDSDSAAPDSGTVTSEEQTRRRAKPRQTGKLRGGR